ncbi:MAG: tRNA (guanosine(46)-N7)-methyltransferase TrmB [Paludibacteraceae bacterium]|nr:tRNA (guanosine(46)-N7)-methyltransferase TrmB [Paludibacteraceae bacterium]
MGKNKLAKFAELETFHHVFQVPSGILLSGKGFEWKGKWNEMFFKNNNPIVLELGCGKGEYTVELARQFPDKNYIGVDIKGNRIWTGARKSLQEGLRNAAFIRTNIEMIHHFFSSNEVSEIWLTFPDPQMKKTSKRLTATNFIRSYLNFLKPEGVIHLKTDSNFMFTYTCEMVKANHFQVIDYQEDIYASESVSPILNIKTYYEQQWLERGIAIKYIGFVPLKNSELIEPDIEIEPDPYRSFKRYRRI